MSLINEALKKAQRLRTEDTGSDAPPMPGGKIAKRSAPRSANTLVLVVSGAIVLVVLSVIATVVLVNRRPKPAAAVATAASPTKSEAKSAPANSAIVAPIVVPPTVTPPADPIANAPAREEPKPAIPVPTKKAASPVAVAPKTTLPAPKPTPPATTAPVPVNPPARSESIPPALSNTAESSPAAPLPLPTVPTPAAPAKPDDRIVAFVEAVRVAGIRSSGTESRVLMNDRVYRVNDIVDRTLGVRLVKVAVDSLTFADANGLTYVKYF